ncbi:MAG: hypothetical protein QXE84_09475 [Candidatus Nitrosotenuis sp.]|uniref:Uncharacterized protein n=1 Tax=Candidatus Nitrosotenuis uzonensis TaxID=1407055 RepID=A0A812EYF8_9ARCH|nr:hypothetical protein NUZ5A_20134 [Candidatus Nitrosotenuis uzonensis]
MIDSFVCSDWFEQQECEDFSSDFFERRPERNITPAITPHMIMQPTRGRTMGRTATVIAELTVEE